MRKWLLNSARRLFFGIVDRATPLSWALFLICVVLTWIAVSLMVGAGYNPNISYAPYAPPFALTVMVYAGVSFVAGISLHLLRNTRAKGPIAMTFALVLLSVPIAAAAIATLTEPPQDTFVQYAGYDAYHIPRVFTRLNGDQEPGESARVSVIYCINDSKGLYDRIFRECHRTSFQLSKGEISSSHPARIVLEALGVPRVGDKITDVSALAREANVVRGHGWTGYTISDLTTGDSRQSTTAHLVLDHDDRIVLLGRCMARNPNCQMVSQTVDGLLSFFHPSRAGFDYRGWKAREARKLGMLRTWRVTD